MSGGGRPEDHVLDIVLRRPAPRSRTQRLFDRALGVSRRKRQLAYVAIGGGLAVLRPLLRRAAAVTGFVVLLIGLAVLF